VVGKAAGAAAGTAAGSTAMMAARGADADEEGNSLGYFIDSLFRVDNDSSTDNAPPQANPTLQDPLAEPATPEANEPAPQILAGREAPPVNTSVPDAMPDRATLRQKQTSHPLKTYSCQQLKSHGYSHVRCTRVRYRKKTKATSPSLSHSALT
jgi:hypothetical protein